MSLPERSLPTSVQTKNVGVFDRDAQTTKVTSGTVSFNVIWNAECLYENAVTESVPSFTLSRNAYDE